MLPSRVGRVVLDGVMNPHEHRYGYDVEMNADTDKAFSAFLQACLERPDACALARAYPVLGGLSLDNARVKTLIRPRLYDPALYPDLARRLALLLQGDLDAFVPLYIEKQAALPAVHTGDLGNGKGGALELINHGSTDPSDTHPPAWPWRSAHISRTAPCRRPARLATRIHTPSMTPRTRAPCSPTLTVMRNRLVRSS